MIKKNSYKQNTQKFSNSTQNKKSDKILKIPLFAYKAKTKIEFLPWDEKMDSIIFTFNTDYFYDWKNKINKRY